MALVPNNQDALSSEARLMGAFRIMDPRRTAGKLPFPPTPEGGGEMSGLLLARDWAHTSLGPIGQWSASLRTLVYSMLAAPSPVFIYWGPDFIQLYNDAARPILGEKHPSSCGEPARTALNEVWQFIEPMLGKVRSSGAATYLEETSRFLAKAKRRISGRSLLHLVLHPRSRR